MATLGVDISLYQPGFDFAKAKKEGVKFAIIKASQSWYVDPEFERHYANAKAAGMPVGAYHYLNATTKAAAIDEAKNFVSHLKGKQFEYPVFVDVESSWQRNIGKAKLTEIVRAFCDYVEQAGYWAGVYFGYDFFLNALDGAALAKRYSLWLPYWSKAYPNALKDYVQIWQFGGEVNLLRSNKLAGVVTDQNYAYIDFPAQIKAKGLNGFAKTTATTAKRTPKAGDTVKISYGAYYPNGKRIPDRITAKTWSVRYAGNGKACLYKSGTEILNAEIEVKYLTVV